MGKRSTIGKSDLIQFLKDYRDGLKDVLGIAIIVFDLEQRSFSFPLAKPQFFAIIIINDF